MVPWRAVIVSVSLAAQSVVTFTAYTSFSPGTAPSAIVAADVAGTTDPDLLLAVGSQVWILESQGFGQPPLTTLLNSVTSPNDIAAGDLDLDGDGDVVAGNASGVSVLRQGPAGWTRVDYAVSAAGKTTIADIDGNGLPDVLRGNLALLAVSPGVFAPPIQVAGASGAADGIAGDFDGDGDMDMVILRFVGPPVSGSTSPSTIFVDRYANNGTLPLALAATISLPSCGVIGEAADMNGDGIADLVLAGSTPHSGGVTFQSILFGPGGASTVLQRSVISGLFTVGGSPSSPRRPLLRDVDGFRDAMWRATSVGLSSTSSDHTLLVMNDGAGALVPGGIAAQQFISGSAPVVGSYDLADLDGDGDLDLIRQDVTVSNIAVNIDVRLASVAPGGPPPQQQIATAIAFLGPPAIAVQRFVNVSQGTSFRVTDATGAPVPGAAVGFSLTPNGGALFLASFLCSSVTTNAQGIATPPSLASSQTQTGSGMLVATIANGASASVTISVVDAVLTAASGSGQARSAGQTFTHPLVAHAADAVTGMPIPGMRVLFAQSTGSTVTIASTAMQFTDAAGNAAMTATAGASSGPATVTARLLEETATHAFMLFVRKLTVSGGAASGSLTLHYVHEDAPTPFVLAADIPQPPTPTPYGDVHTSIAAPGPFLYVADPLGTFGAADPGLVAAPTFTRAVPLPPSVAGINLVFQIYGFDPTYFPDLIQAVFISNPQYHTL